MPYATLGQCLEVIADLVEGQRPAKQHHYEVIWIKDHFVCRPMQKTEKGEFFIIKLMGISINEGLTNRQWDNASGRIRFLKKVEVIK